MPTMVRFRTLDGTYAIPVVNAVEVRRSTSVIALPAPAIGVAGIIERDGATLPVVNALGGGTRHVLVVTSGEDQVGLLVEEVTGVFHISEAEIGAPPPGQDGPLVDGVLSEADGMTFVVAVGELINRVRPEGFDEMAARVKVEEG
jgi:chemotaxis signal transduction protein